MVSKFVTMHCCIMFKSCKEAFSTRPYRVLDLHQNTRYTLFLTYNIDIMVIRNESSIVPQQDLPPMCKTQLALSNTHGD